MTKLRSLIFNSFVASLLLLPSLVAASEAGHEAMPSAQIDLGDTASLQRGAGLYMNYCAGCHSLGYQRYSRIAEDLGLSKEQVEQNLIFSEAKFGETIATGVDPAKGQLWFGKAPPDLSVVARTKHEGGDWIYNYLKGFYIDESRPLGWNNTVFEGASMPNVLWELQGIQRPVYEHGEATHKPKLELVTPGRLSAEEFDKVARDLSGFLQYTAEPAALQRESIGVWVVLFLAFFTLLAYLLKTEYWRDVH